MPAAVPQRYGHSAPDERSKSILAHVGGVPANLWFDNVSPVVERVSKKADCELIDQFLRVENCYGFSKAFCNLGKVSAKKISK